MRDWCLLALLVACSAHSISGSSTLRLRGGAWGGGGKKDQPQQDISTDMLSNAAAAHTPAPAVAPESGPPQINLATHAFEYALAGGFDGIRSGVGQAVGSSFAQWVGGALQKGGSGAGMAFAGLFGKLPFFRGMRKPGSRSSQSQAQSSPAQIPVTGVVICYVTVPSDEVADLLATTLVQAGLVACVNQVPGITSTYVWQGKMQRDSESLLIIKTNREQLAEVATVVKEKHPFENPEFICLDVNAGLPAYLNWIRGMVGPMSGHGP